MAVKGIGSNYLYSLQNDYMSDLKAEDIATSVSYTTVQSEGVCYEKTISDSVSAGIEFIQGMEKQLPGTKLFVGTVKSNVTEPSALNTELEIFCLTTLLLLLILINSLQ